MALRSLGHGPSAAGHAQALASWQRDAVHLWGWDGGQTMPPMWLYGGFRERGWPAPPSSYGFHSSLDVTAPNGERLRPMSVRLDAVAGMAWLRGVTSAASDSVRWFGTLAALAGRVVDAGAITPLLALQHDPFPSASTAVSAEARWVSVAGPAVDDALDALHASMPPICLPDVPAADLAARRAAVQHVFDAFVDHTARAALQVAGWEPELPRDRSTMSATVRLVFRGLVGQDHRVLPAKAGQAEALGVIDDALRRQRHRSRGEPVVRRRARLVVPDERDLPWSVVLELVDEGDAGRWCSADDVWSATPLAVEVAGGAEHLPVLELTVLETASAIAERVDVLAPLGALANPAVAELDVDSGEVDEFLAQAPAELERLGVELIGPEHLVRSSVAVRGTASPAPASDRAAGLSRETLVEWSFTASDGGGAFAIAESELERAERIGSSLLHIGHRWVRIDPAALRRAKARRDLYLRQAEELAALEREGELSPLELMRLAAELAAAGDQLDARDDLDGVETLDGAERMWAGRLLTGLPDTELREELEPPQFHGELRPYQRRGLSWLRFLLRLGLGGCLADDMGLGKTATTLAHLVDRPGPHLVVCPLSVVHNWETEAGRFAPSMAVRIHHGTGRAGGDAEDAVTSIAAADLVVTTYGLVTRDIELLSGVEWATVVLDEAQFVKNPSTRSARAVRKLRAGQRIALTGTPVENRLSELWALLDWANPGMLGSRERFRHRYSKPIERAEDPADAAEAAAALKTLTQPFVLRRSKADRQLVPELPDKIEQVAFAGLTREQTVLYQKVVEQLIADAGAQDAAGQRAGMKRRSIVLAALTKLKQICNHPAHALGDGSRLDGRSGKLARFDELVDELVDVGERALVFTQFVEMGALLQRHLTERRGWVVPFLQGSMSKSRRDATVAAFQAGEGPPLLIVSLKAGGTGLNLTAASQVIHYDRWWNPAVENQATDRAWRIGQGQTVLVHKLVCEGTVEERIATLIDDKQRLADLVVGQGESWLSELSTADLRELVRLDTGPAGDPEAAR